jgi:hypothetical protein
MDNESKVISGLWRPRYFDVTQRHQIIQEFLSSGRTKNEIWAKYNDGIKHHGEIVRWMRHLGYNCENPKRRAIFVENNTVMPKNGPYSTLADESFEILQLKKRVNELEKQLKDSEMKAIAFSTMIDIAETEFNIPIRKKSNTKPLK